MFFRSGKARWLSSALLGAGLLLIAFFALRAQAPAAPESSSLLPPEISSIPASSEPPAEEPALAAPYPVGEMVLTGERLDYRDETMVLRVPRLDLIAPVWGEIDPETRRKVEENTLTPEEKQAFYANANADELLDKGVMLFHLSPLPNAQNANVTISGHRDIRGKEFYYIDTITEGDRLYLDYDGRTYAYEYLDTEIVASDDWSPLRIKDFSALTLISCDPIGTSRNRIVVTARLIEHG